MTKRIFILCYGLIFFLLSLLIYHELILKDPLIDFDDKTLILPLQKVSSWNDYLAAPILDLQPVRDLSYLLDLYVLKNFNLGFGTFHLQNYLIWLLINWSVFRLFRRFDLPSPYALGALLLFTVHPVFVGSVGWISARKHLLSALFTLINTNLILAQNLAQNRSQEKLSTQKILLLALNYLLAGLSQPINLLWVGWAFLIHKNRATAVRNLWPCLLLGGILLGLNYDYYTRVFEQMGMTEKFIPMTSLSQQLTLIFLALGRALWQIIVPTQFAAYYYAGSLSNIWGMYLLLTLVILGFLNRERQALLHWFSFALFPLILIVIRPTRVFLNDTYLLLFTVGIFCLGLQLLQQLRSNGRNNLCKKISLPLFAGLLSCYFYHSREVATYWMSGPALWQNSYANEPSPENALGLAKKYFAIKKYDDAFSLLNIVIEDYQYQDPTIPLLIGETLYHHPQFTFQQKLSYFQKYHFDNSWFVYYQAKTYFQLKQYSQGLSLLADYLQDPRLFAEESPKIGAEFAALCARYPTPVCQTLLPKFADYLKNQNWDPQVYSQHLRQWQSIPLDR